MSWVRIIGKFLISVGVGVLLFVAWVLWGTGIYTSGQQDRLAEEFRQLPDIQPERVKPEGKDERRFVGPGDDFKPSSGTPVFSLTIPKIDVANVVVQGVEVEDLKLGPGHYPDCRGEFVKPLCTDAEEVWPGEEGRVILSGHRTTYGAPFGQLDKLEPGDEIITDTQWGKFTYVVTEIEIVSPNSTDIANPQPGGSNAEIALTTCHPEFSASQRLIVFGEIEEVA